MNAAAASEAATKDFANLQAVAALRGYAVEAIDGGAGPEFILTSTRWPLTRRCGSLEELRSLMTRMGLTA